MRPLPTSSRPAFEEEAAGAIGEADTGAEGEEEARSAAARTLLARRPPADGRQRVHVEADRPSSLPPMCAKKRSRTKKARTKKLPAGADADSFSGGEMSETTHAALPVSQKTVFKRERRGGGAVEARMVVWPDHESFTYVLSTNGKKLYLSLAPGEVRGFALAMLAVCDERKW
jgi:hypothetical protein